MSRSGQVFQSVADRRKRFDGALDTIGQYGELLFVAFRA